MSFSPSPVFSFPPVVHQSSRVLLLGSMPGVTSLNRQEYYAHPRNLFWKLLAEVFATTAPDHWQAKLQFLEAHHLALWDVCHSCIRSGSLDQSIRDVVPNNVPGLLAQHPGIHVVLFNGKAAEKLYLRHFKTVPDIQWGCLPSSSPANAGIGYLQKREQWCRLKEWARA